MGSFISFREDVNVSKKYKEVYVSGIDKVIETREEEARKHRKDFCGNIFLNQEKYREDFKAMLGWPLTEKKPEDIPDARIETLSDDELCTIYRISFEILDGLFMTGLLFQKDEAKKPLVITQHGGWGTPEHAANLYGYTTNYNHMIERMLQFDVNVFAPQLLLWKDTYGVDYDRTLIDARLKRVGSSITAVEVYGITRILDYFEKQDYVSNFGMIGLSYGGFYTLFTAAIDTRIKSAFSCSFFNTRKDNLFSDWSWFGVAESFSDSEVACLIYPRELCIEVGTRDELFDVQGALDEWEFLKEVSKMAPTEWQPEFIEFDGTHEFCKDDAPLKRLAESIQ